MTDRRAAVRCQSWFRRRRWRLGAVASGILVKRRCEFRLLLLRMSVSAGLPAAIRRRRERWSGQRATPLRQQPWREARAVARRLQMRVVSRRAGVKRPASGPEHVWSTARLTQDASEQQDETSRTDARHNLVVMQIDRASHRGRRCDADQHCSADDGASRPRRGIRDGMACWPLKAGRRLACPGCLFPFGNGSGSARDRRLRPEAGRTERGRGVGTGCRRGQAVWALSSQLKTATRV